MSKYKTETADVKYQYFETSTNTVKYGRETVSRYMHIDMHECDGKGGSSPKSLPLSNVMKSLNLAFYEESFIKGHLLNEKLGGEGEYDNLFPITSKANSEHHAQVEKPIKEFFTKNKQDITGTYSIDVLDKNGDEIDSSTEILEHDFYFLCDYDLESKKNPQDKLKGIKYVHSSAKGNNILFDTIMYDYSFKKEHGGSTEQKKKLENSIRERKFELFTKSMKYILDNLAQHIDLLDTNRKSEFIASCKKFVVSIESALASAKGGGYPPSKRPRNTK